MRPTAAQRRLLERRREQGKELERGHEAFLADLDIDAVERGRMREAGVSSIDAMLGPAPVCDQVRRKTRALAKSPLPVLVQGPDGTAKTAIASLLHFGNGRKGLLRHVDLASVTDVDAAEILLGRAGARLRNRPSRVGLVVQANGGALVMTRVELASESVQRLAVGIGEEKKRFLRRVGADLPIIAETKQLRRDLEETFDSFGENSPFSDACLQEIVAEVWVQIADHFCSDLIAAFNRTGNNELIRQLRSIRKRYELSHFINLLRQQDSRRKQRPTSPLRNDYERIALAIDEIERRGELDVRIISTAGLDLGHRVQNGAFRRDLYDNLSASIIQVPPLNDRGEEEIQAFIGQAVIKYGGDMKGLDVSYDKKLTQADWSANNLRGLRHEVRRAVAYALADDCILRERDLHEESVIKGRVGISSLNMGGRSFESMTRGDRASAVADAMSATITANKPMGSKAAARRVLLKRGVQVSLQTIVNYLDLDEGFVVYNGSEGRYCVRRAT